MGLVVLVWIGQVIPSFNLHLLQHRQSGQHKIALRHLHISEKMMAEGHGLGDLQVGEARHHRCGVLLRLPGQGELQLLQLGVEDVIAEGSKLVWRLRLNGTHRGVFLGVEATGKRVSYDLISIARVEGGKIAERWTLFDKHAILQQLGAIPEHIR